MLSPSSRRPWWAAMITVLLAVGVSVYLTVLHFKVLSIGFTGKSLCNLSSLLNCDLVLTSNLSEIGTLPLAGLGLIFYVYLFVSLLYARKKVGESLETLLAFPLLLTIGACLFSLFLAYESLFILRSVCVFCSSLYFLNFFLLFFLISTAKLTWGTTMGRLKELNWKRSLGFFAIIFFSGGILLHLTHRLLAKELTEDMIQKYTAAFFQQTAEKIDTDGRPYWGNPDAKVVIAEFSDYECPYCKLAAFNLKPMLQSYKDKVKLVFLNYPLDKSCNPNMPQELHLRACAVAYANHCAALQGKFWEYHDEAFDRQPRYQESSLLSIAKKLKLDLGQFQACMQSETTKNYVLQDIDRAKQLKVEGTPAVFVNGRLLPEWRVKKLLLKIVEDSIGGK